MLPNSPSILNAFKKGSKNFEIKYFWTSIFVQEILSVYIKLINYFELSFVCKICQKSYFRKFSKKIFN
jgi:hypothetical protein